jgi:dihydrofolate synthase/folylpolyglutamate synthase
VYNPQHDITESFELDLNGIYQVNNLCTVLCAEGILMKQEFTISNEAEKKALGHTKEITGLRGRWDVISHHPAIILDVAHNEDGMRMVLNQLKNTGNTGKIHFVMGMVNDKDVMKVLSMLPQNAVYYFTNAHIPRAMPHTELMDKAATHGLTGKSFDNVNDALRAAAQVSVPNDTIIVCGSVFVVGEVDPHLFR